MVVGGKVDFFQDLVIETPKNNVLEEPPTHSKPKRSKHYWNVLANKLIQAIQRKIMSERCQKI